MGTSEARLGFNLRSAKFPIQSLEIKHALDILDASSWIELPLCLFFILVNLCAVIV
jgi:hypothetical protein